MLIKALLKTQKLILTVLKDRRGQAMVEMAIILPLLLLILMSTVEMGRIFNTYLVINNASREGARTAALGQSETLVAQRIDDVTASLDSTKLGTPVITPASSLRRSGELVTVSLNYQLDIITPMMSGILPNPFPLQSSTTMRME